MIKVKYSASQIIMVSIKMVSGFFQDRSDPEVMKVEPEASSETTVVTEVHAEKSVFETWANIHFDESNLLEVLGEVKETGSVLDVGSVETADLFSEITEADIREIDSLFLTEEGEDELGPHATNLQWPARVRNLRDLVGPVRAKTRLQLTPLSGGRSIMREHLKVLFEKEIRDMELGSMA
ncbi:LAQU0S01e09802g1_1 [Lachancea quebecensis]|uniref:LAQU0S01e09802g1_1 n=1 Tax=Lachancea quebecensis TaxID=1654605 RepID=A0A0P1KPP6_9SACH|nr:LAQU0S01e09802g1_1 [Lachancea quebecensis]